MRKKTIIPNTSVRIIILNELINKSYPIHFSEIRRLIHKHDAVTGRELKTLVESGIVIKNSEGLYSINVDSKEYHDILTQLALKSGSEWFHYLMDSLDMHVFISCEEIDKELIKIDDILQYFEENTVDRFTDSVLEIIAAKSKAVINNEFYRGDLPKTIPFRKEPPYTMKPCKIMITFNMPFFKERMF
jgi:hypothetical protein